MKKLFLYLAEEYLGEVTVDSVRGHETWMFRFDESAVRMNRPLLDPAIANVRGPQYAAANSIFGFLSDIAPDRWGRRLIRRREKRNLQESDYLLGVCDLTRAGALRIKLEKDGEFVAADCKDAAPPWTTLRRLEESARNFDALDEGAEAECWLRDLLNPGSSLGGARPKANVTAPNGDLWIAKFPSVRDEWDVGLREYETSVLARKCGLNVPETRCQKFSKSGTTFFTKRFDRVGNNRIPYASAMTMIGAKDGEEGHGYLEIAEFISAYSADPEADLHELWGRMAFSELVSNTDDHLRNHGFLLTKAGWRLSPLFDVNPNPEGGAAALDRGDLIGDAAYYRLTKRAAQDRYSAMRSVVNGGGVW